MCCIWYQLLCQDVFGSRMCLRHNCSAKEKGETGKGEQVFKKVEKLYYLGKMFISHYGASERASAKICIAWKKSRKLAGILVRRLGLSLKHHGEITNAVSGQLFCFVVKLRNSLSQISWSWCGWGWCVVW